MKLVIKAFTSICSVHDFEKEAMESRVGINMTNIWFHKSFVLFCIMSYSFSVGVTGIALSMLFVMFAVYSISLFIDSLL